MKDFIYHVPTKVYFGPDQLGHLGAEVARFGQKVLLTYGGGSIKRSGLYDRVMAELKKADLTIFELGGIEPNPRHTSCNRGAKICREQQIDVILAVGGGSVIDASKFIGAGFYSSGDIWDLVTGKEPIKDCLPIVDILTLSATGSEMDTGGVVTNLETGDKIGRGAECMRPRVSFLDPTNTFTVGAYQTACGCADILSHLFEVYFNMEPDLFLLDTVMEGLMKTVIKYGPRAIAKPDDYEARANLMWASSWAINDFVNGGKDQAWSCHPIEHELSAYYDITHGLGLAIITPRWLNYCLDERTKKRYYRFGVEVFGFDPHGSELEIAQKSIAAVSSFLSQGLNLESHLAKLGIDSSKFELMADKACRGSKIAGFKDLYPQDVVNILNESL